MRLIILLTIISTSSFGQWIASDEVDTAKVKSWVPKLTIEYQGVYHFGDSENESDLVLIFTLDGIVGQIRSGFWSTDGKSWVWKYENLGDIQLKQNKFIAENIKGEFVTYDNGTSRVKGLKIYEPWSDMPEQGQWEIGLRKNSADEYYSGKFTSASLRMLDEIELSKMTKSDLRLMRNEIFARYGLKFKSGGEMDNYFNKQTWYHPNYDTVDEFLTTIEKGNIKIIQRIESR